MYHSSCCCFWCPGSGQGAQNEPHLIKTFQLVLSHCSNISSQEVSLSSQRYKQTSSFCKTVCRRAPYGPHSPTSEFTVGGRSRHTCTHTCTQSTNLFCLYLCRTCVWLNQIRGLLLFQCVCVSGWWNLWGYGWRRGLQTGTARKQGLSCDPRIFHTAHSLMNLKKTVLFNHDVYTQSRYWKKQEFIIHIHLMRDRI